MPLNIDPLFSEKIRNFEKTYAGVKLDEAEIYKLYNNHEPIYFHMQDYAEVNTELRQFVESEKFSQFIEQLEKCFTEINAFIVANDIKVETRFSENDNAMSGMQIVEVSAKVVLDRFFDKLKTDHFADRRAILYGEGKQYLEKLSILLNQSGINVEDRIIQLRTMVDDDVLELCADGCFSRLQSTVENLKDKLDFKVDGWMRKFIKNQLNEVLQKPQLLSGQTPAQKLALISNQHIENNEIHLNNWFKAKLKNELQLEFMEIPSDMYVEAIDRYLEQHANNKRLATIEYEQTKKDFLSTITASNFVEFIASDMHYNLHSIVKYMELVNKLENTLKLFGQDESFNWEEILDLAADPVTLKSQSQIFYKTIVLRLLESSFFTKDQVILDEISSEHYQFQFFKKNLRLHLIKQINAEEPIFLNLFEFIKQPQQLTQIYDSITANKKNNFLAELMQTPEDFVLFMNSLDFSRLQTFTHYLLEGFASLKTSYNLYFPDRPQIDQSKLSLFVPTFEVIYSMLSHLNGGIGQTETAKDFFYKEIIRVNGFKQVFNNYLVANANKVLAPQLANNEIKTVLEKLLVMGVNDFSHILFLGKNSLNYLSQINFSGCDFSYAVFQVVIRHCILSGAKLNNIEMLASPALFDVILIKANLANAFIYGEVYSVFFSMSKISDTTFFSTIDKSVFDEADLIRIKFNEIHTTTFLKAKISANTFAEDIGYIQFDGAQISTTTFAKNIGYSKFDRAKISATTFAGALEASIFNQAVLTKVKFSKVVETNFYEAQISDSVFSEMIKSSTFNQATLNGITFKEILTNHCEFTQTKISHSLFENIEYASFIKATLNNVAFNKLFNTVFNGAQISHTFFKGEVTEIAFLKATLTEVKFDTLMVFTDFAEAVLTDSEFTHLDRPNFLKASLKKISIEKLCGGKFKDAILENVKFREIFTKEEIKEKVIGKFDIDFSGADLTQVSFESIKLQDNEINFSHAKLKDLTFRALDLTETSGVNFCNTKFEAVIFDDVKFNRVRFSENEFNDVIFRNCDLSQVVFDFKEDSSAQIKLEKVQLNPYQLITFYTSGIRDFSSIQLNDIASVLGHVSFQDFLEFEVLPPEQRVQEFLTRYELPGVKLSEQAFEYLASRNFRNFQGTDLQLISHETLAKYVMQPDYQFENANFPEGFSFYGSACSGIQIRKKRSLIELCSRLREKMSDDNNKYLVQDSEKVIDSMTFLNVRYEWQQKVAPILEGLEGNWLPKLITAKSLMNGNEEVVFINLDTQEDGFMNYQVKPRLRF